MTLEAPMLAQDEIQARPAIYITRADLDLLSEIIGAGAERMPGGALLREELDRAIVQDGDAPARFVRLGDEVEFEDLTTGRTRKVTVVAPGEADIDAGRISVLTPVGAALIGMTEGAAFSWEDWNGRAHALRVAAVREPKR